jgi:hypothetical protein
LPGRASCPSVCASSRRLQLNKKNYPEIEASTALRRHFSSRTAALLVPLNRYLNTLIPTPSETLRARTTNWRLKPFNDSSFFASLKTYGVPLPFRSSRKQREFYERWLRTPAFGLWLAQQEEVVERVLRENAEQGTGDGASSI